LPRFRTLKCPTLAGVRERDLTAGELELALREIGIDRSGRWIQAAWKLGAPRVTKRTALLSETLNWMRENRDIRPRAQNPSRMREQ
jgi:hypothetical protein